MTAQFRGLVFRGLYRFRKRLLWFGLAVLSGVAVAGWSVWGDGPPGRRAPSDWSAGVGMAGAADAGASVMPAQPPSTQPVVPEASPAELAAFEQACQSTAMRRLYHQARQNCLRFIGHPTLAGQAHAALAALLAAPPLQDLDAAVEHARQAVRLGDARGDFILGLLMLSGHVQPWSVEQAQALLTRANGNGVTVASRYIEHLATQRECPARTSLKPLDVPLFCLFRADVVQQLQARGMKHRIHHEGEWRDEFTPGDTIGADAVDLAFDVDPREQVPRLARMRYAFEAVGRSTARWGELFDGLSRRYGPAGSVSRGQQAVWPMPDGTVVRLSREGERCFVAYEHPARLKQRDEHLAQVRDGLREARLLAEAHAL